MAGSTPLLISGWALGRTTRSDRSGSRTSITLSSGMPKQAKHSRAGWNQRGVNGRP